MVMQPDARQRLLDAAIDHVGRHGLADRSLRQLASELGTSHRMLIHHFGSKDGLWLAIVREVEQRQLASLGELTASRLDAPGSAGGPATLSAVMWMWWRHISDPSLWPNERLFFELYGQALQGRSPADELLEGVVESWLAPAVAMAEAAGLPADEARDLARLGLAVTRGLLLDLLATEDRAGVDAAMGRWIELMERTVGARDRSAEG